MMHSYSYFDHLDGRRDAAARFRWTDAIGAAVFAFLALWLLVFAPAPPQTAPQAPQPLQFVANPYHEPIATWDERERTLTIGEHWPGDALLCIGDDCRRPQDFLHRPIGLEAGR